MYLTFKLTIPPQLQTIPMTPILMDMAFKAPRTYQPDQGF